MILSLLALCEAATKLAGGCPEVVQEHPEGPWREMRGTRNRMVHGYFDINLDVVWDTVQQGSSNLRQVLLATIASMH